VLWGTNSDQYEEPRTSRRDMLSQLFQIHTSRNADGVLFQLQFSPIPVFRYISALIKYPKAENVPNIQRTRTAARHPARKAQRKQGDSMPKVFEVLETPYNPDTANPEYRKALASVASEFSNAAEAWEAKQLEHGKPLSFENGFHCGMEKMSLGLYSALMHLILDEKRDSLTIVMDMLETIEQVHYAAHVANGSAPACSAIPEIRKATTITMKLTSVMNHMAEIKAQAEGSINAPIKES